MNKPPFTEKEQAEVVPAARVALSNSAQSAFWEEVGAVLDRKDKTTDLIQPRKSGLTRRP